ncbi:LysR family transcriptional regulator [Zavarzinia compransoris]|uniref:LysR family transcriptional regulator n=1 Tax=Zavarzinia compransoris TaxID=1264899 RepID=A0A317EA10_9PROT|nr:LysR family transcriptional regulator [Zavarzinia compransoris]PWR23541.1 LysR family transcriptional regulator [Zavarzinia compransoris]TDP47751.1 LysR family transcriptional regulator [Zavarzinia compransoris]
MDPRAPTLDQLHVFLAVVECGGFAAAARKLGRAASVVSYQIANLETQLGLALFDRERTRRPRLTEAGLTVLADGRAIAGRLDQLLARTRGLQQGLEAEVSLVVDVMLPMARLAPLLERFRDAFPTVALRLHVEGLGSVAEMVLAGRAGLGLSGPLLNGSDALERRAAGGITLVPVAAPTHPLAALPGPIPEAATREHLQLVLTDRSPLTAGRDFFVLGMRTWRLGDLGAKHALLRAGIGWGSMPAPLVAEDLAAGSLCRLPIDAWDDMIYKLRLVHRVDNPPGPAGRWLADALAAWRWAAP